MTESKQSIRTKKFLTKSLMDLIIEKDFEDISVTDICEKALITRATFYKYFEDKYNLAQYLLYELEEQIFEKGLQNFSYNSPKELYLKLTELCYDYINCHQHNFFKFIKHSYGNRLRLMILSTINDYIENITKKEQHNFNFKIPVEIVSKFTTGGFAYLMLYMIENNTTFTKEEILKWTNEVLCVMLKN